MNNNEKLELSIEIYTDSANKNIKNLDTSLKNFENLAVQSAKKTSSGFDGMTKSIFKGVLGANAIYDAMTRAAFAVGQFARESVKMAMDAVESENLFAVSMGSMSEEAANWSRELSKSLGLNQYELRKNIGTFNVMLESMGVGTSKAYEMAKALAQLSYDMASFYNLKPEEAFIKLQAGISGETEPLRRLGINILEETTRLYAYKTGIAEVGKELTQNQKILARYGSIMEQTSRAQGDLARTINSPANQLRVLKSRTDELQTSLGMAFLPTISAVTGELIGMSGAIGTSNSGLRNLAGFISGPIMAFYELASIIAEVRMNLAKWEMGIKNANPLATKREKEYIAKVYRDAAADVLKYQERLQKLQNNIDAIGKFDYNAAKAAAVKEQADLAAAKASTIHSKSIDKLKSSQEIMEESLSRYPDDISLYTAAVKGLYAVSIDKVRELKQLNDDLLEPFRDIMAEARRSDSLEIEPTKTDTGEMEKIIKEREDAIEESIQYAERRTQDLRESAGRIFDDLISRSGSIWANLRDSFMNIFLAPVRMAFQNLAVGMFGGMMGGGQQSSGMLNLGGMFGGGSASASTPPFVPSGSGGGFSLGSLSSFNPSGIKSMFGIGSSAASINPMTGAMTSSTPWGSLTTMGKLGQILKSPGGMMGSGMLGIAGLQMGGPMGAVMSTAGMAGTGYGLASMLFPKLASAGIWGAAIGGAAGLIGGLVSLFSESPEEAMARKIKKAYGVSVKDDGVLRQFVQMARSSYAGNYDMFIRSSQGRDLVELYANQTGQRMKNARAGMTSTTLFQSGGGLYQSASYSNGMVSSPMSSLPGAGLGGVSSAGMQSGVQVINITIPGAKQFFEDETVKVIKNNPRQIASAVVSSLKGNFGRKELSSLTLNPGVINA